MIDIEVSIDPELRPAAPDLALGLVCASVQVREYDERLWSQMNSLIAGIQQKYDLAALPEVPEIRALRRAFRATGKEPSRYRGSQESLFRRILQGKGLAPINTVVDINNFLSLESRHSVGCYDLAKVCGPVTFRVGRPGESYKPVGKEPVNVAGLPVFADRDGPFGSPTRDSERTMVTLSTVETMMVIISFSGRQGLAEFTRRAADLLKAHASADGVRIWVLEGWTGT